MNVHLSVDEMAALSNIRERAFKAIADALGKDHAITRAMGPLAWGRHEFQGGPDDKGVRYEALKLGYLIGRFDSLNIWARDNDALAQRVMLKLWPHSWSPQVEQPSGR